MLSKLCNESISYVINKKKVKTITKSYNCYYEKLTSLFFYMMYITLI